MFGDDCEPLVLSPHSLLEDDLDTEVHPASKSTTIIKSVDQHTYQPSSRPLLTRTIPTASINTNEDLLITPHGTVKVSKAGNPSGPAILTFHDLGLNSASNFQVIDIF